MAVLGQQSEQLRLPATGVYDLTPHSAQDRLLESEDASECALVLRLLDFTACWDTKRYVSSTFFSSNAFAIADKGDVQTCRVSNDGDGLKVRAGLSQGAKSALTFFAAFRRLLCTSRLGECQK